MRPVGRALVALGLTVAATATVVAAGAPPASAAAGSTSDGRRTLSVSQVDALDPTGQVVQVSGSGYDPSKGIYVGFCVVPPTGQPPSPCGGGVDMAGASGVSHWISSNPPAHGEGLAEPYGPNGSFSVTLAISPALSASIDCRRVRCAVVTRNDHVRSSDRSQDVFVPVTFAADAARDVVVPDTAGPEPVAPPSTEPAPVDSMAPDTTEVSAPTTTTAPATTTSEPSPTDDELAAAHRAGASSSPAPLLIVLGLALAGLATAAAIVIARRRASP